MCLIAKCFRSIYSVAPYCPCIQTLIESKLLYTHYQVLTNKINPSKNSVKKNISFILFLISEKKKRLNPKD